VTLAVVRLQWRPASHNPSSSKFVEEFYGPWDASNEFCWEEMAGFLRRWRQVTDVEPEIATLGLLTDPTTWPPSTRPAVSAEDIAQAFHETYEGLAPGHGYETRKASAVPWTEVPRQNRDLMVAVVANLLTRGVITTPTT
jgi:hypothetical protein